MEPEVYDNAKFYVEETGFNCYPDLDDNDKRLLYKTFKGNKKMLSALNMKKKEFKIDILNAVEEALLYSYK